MALDMMVIKVMIILNLVLCSLIHMNKKPIQIVDAKYNGFALFQSVDPSK